MNVRMIASSRRASNVVPLQAASSRRRSSSSMSGGGASGSLGLRIRAIGLSRISPSSTSHLKNR
jgi:hypothetical protein